MSEFHYLPSNQPSKHAPAGPVWARALDKSCLFHKAHLIFIFSKVGVAGVIKVEPAQIKSVTKGLENFAFSV